MGTTSHILHENLSSYDIDSKNIFAVNEDVYALLVESLSKEHLQNTAQPKLIVGESGSGKTFLIKKLQDKIEKDICETLHPIVIEGKSLYSTTDIWNQCVSLLNIAHKEDSFNTILEWQERNSKRIVLFIDNIQYYFNRTDNTEHYGLRGKLNRSGSPILIASSEKVLTAFTEYSAAFFDGFKIMYLKSVDAQTVMNITSGRYDISRLENMMSYLPKTIRSMFIAIDIMERSDDSKKDIALLLDLFHSHYQERFDTSTTQAQRILTALAQADAGLNLAEIRAITEQENGKISPYLKLMTDQKTIRKEAKTLRGGKYSIKDPLFKLWLRYNIANENRKMM